MEYLIAILINSVITQLQHSIHSLNPAVLEVIKLIAVSCAWIGGLSWFMIRKDKRRQQANA